MDINNQDKFYVGFDIHEDNFYGTIMDKSGNIIAEGNVKYSKEGIQNFLGFMPSTKYMIAIEACGLSRGVYKLLTDLGYDVVQANPLKTNRIAAQRKTDKVDSKILADLLRTNYLPITYVPSDYVLKLRDISRHRVRLVRTRVVIQLRIKSYLSRDGIKFPGGWNQESLARLREMSPMIENFVNIIEVINEQIKPIEREIRSIARNNRLTVLMQTTPGIGEISSVLILGEIGDIKRFDNPKSLVNYAGLCPGVFQTNKTCYDVINNETNKWLKWILTECAGRAMTYDNRYLKHYSKVNERKGWKIARKSLARKMLNDIWYILSNEVPYKY